MMAMATLVLWIWTEGRQHGFFWQRLSLCLLHCCFNGENTPLTNFRIVYKSKKIKASVITAFLASFVKDLAFETLHHFALLLF